MLSTPVTFTLAEYCQQFDTKQVVINRDYQRASVWPASARSSLIDTILCGYPIPKILLRQKTDLRTRKTTKEVVDGQQRTLAIVDFFNDDLVLSIGKFRGKRFSTLDDEDKVTFLGYPISADLFPEATDEDIREVFRRINSYTVPLNPQELRYATYQGAFKWFIAGLAHTYAQALKDLGVFSEAQLSRMADSEFLSEVSYVLLRGIESSSNAKLNKLYKDFETSFPQESLIRQAIDEAFSVALEMEALRRSALMTRYNFFSLLTAIAHARHRFSHLPEIEVKKPLSSGKKAQQNLLVLADALERKDAAGPAGEFVKASSEATNRKDPRLTRFRWMCRALSPDPVV